jgi:ligand-binding SRPBCC domain-containing protein
MKIEYSSVANCPPERIWNAFVQTEQWPRYSDHIQSVGWIEGAPWQQGSKLVIEIKQPPARLKATAAEVSPPYRFTSTASMMGIVVKHHLEFIAEGPGTLIRSSIDVSGPAAFFINDAMKQKGLQQFEAFMQAVKAKCETLEP